MATVAKTGIVIVAFFVCMPKIEKRAGPRPDRTRQNRTFDRNDLQPPVRNREVVSQGRLRLEEWSLDLCLGGIIGFTTCGRGWRALCKQPSGLVCSDEDAACGER